MTEHRLAITLGIIAGVYLLFVLIGFVQARIKRRREIR